ncbi:MAG: glycosyltransferase family 2 protein [Candidatus Thiodiazotropha sp. (ex Ctena orbiculata)]|uniref:Glycosyltransferase family 2 protein n=1 Tax=Candidatus Thiodiazotropha taylori TaxID=2792791 RepID=A0A944QSM4_9GAMM|nr:glycosyltransferase family 2 protein [Candidatus Thiodiazotropha taylori]MBV2136332.1 glycosyltransferase family 2 protein [Candidatus Thiodiazotropha taylori]
MSHEDEMNIDLSIIVPLYNEEENIQPLIEEIDAALLDYDNNWEVILVDDGSSDETNSKLKAILKYRSTVYRMLTLQRNYGQTAAMQAGFDHSRGRYIVTLDGDLQNDPADIPKFVQLLEQDNLDLVVGWRRNRKDDFWLRKLPSRIANFLIGRVTGIRLHDYGCSLKAYRGSVLRNMQLYGDMHRFIPALMSMYTSPKRIREVKANHRPRVNGTSKYGIGRTFKVLIDLLSVYFFVRFLSRPGHFFGRIGLLLGGSGSLMLIHLGITKFLLHENIGSRPMLFVAIMLVLMGVQTFTTGILSELSSRTYYASKKSRPYILRNDQESSSHTCEDGQTTINQDKSNLA